MVELESVFPIKYKMRDSTELFYAILTNEDDEFFYVDKGGFFNKKFYHYMRISVKEYLDAIKDKREIPGSERDS